MKPRKSAGTSKIGEWCETGGRAEIFVLGAAVCAVLAAGRMGALEEELLDCIVRKWCRDCVREAEFVRLGSEEVLRIVMFKNVVPSG